MRVAKGDQRAFASIVDHYTPIIYPYLLYWIKNVHLVQEVTQDVFVRVWNNREKLPEIANFAGYLYVIARNKANSALHAELLGVKNELSEAMEAYLVQPPSSLEAKELEALLHTLIETLPPKRREIFKLSRELGLTYEEIAQQQGISRNTVKGHMVAALVYLRDNLKEHSDMLLLVISLYSSVYLPLVVILHS